MTLAFIALHFRCCLGLQNIKLLLLIMNNKLHESSGIRLLCCTEILYQYHYWLVHILYPTFYKPDKRSNQLATLSTLNQQCTAALKVAAGYGVCHCYTSRSRFKQWNREDDLQNKKFCSKIQEEPPLLRQFFPASVSRTYWNSSTSRNNFARQKFLSGKIFYLLRPCLLKTTVWTAVYSEISITMRISRHSFHSDKTGAVCFYWQPAPSILLSVWRRRRKSCVLLWRMHYTERRSSTRRTWLSWSRGCRPSTRPSGTRSISPTKRRPTSASLWWSSRFVPDCFLFIIT